MNSHIQDSVQFWLYSRAVRWEKATFFEVYAFAAIERQSPVPSGVPCETLFQKK